MDYIYALCHIFWAYQPVKFLLYCWKHFCMGKPVIYLPPSIRCGQQSFSELLLENIVICVHPASVLEPERIINYPVHSYEFVPPELKFALCQTEYVEILITGSLKLLIKYPEIIVSLIAEIIDPGRVKSCKVVVKVVGNELALPEWFTVLGQHVATIDDHICLKLFCYFEQSVIFPLASVQVCCKQHSHQGPLEYN
uniref:Uncharacterized protein n=1 Tax=Candidatus Methanogaster sp. ANME-2c ERB4 TaxID=2759911 RepID=A0A7G9YHI8_9EURY|nr:hypothetical protein IILFPGFB_00045 [Methanosarcinales archaeon ANME-2c ERB4]